MTDRKLDDDGPSTVYAAGIVLCPPCNTVWRCVATEEDGVPSIAGFQCLDCGAMSGVWVTKPVRFRDFDTAHDAAKAAEIPDEPVRRA